MAAMASRVRRLETLTGMDDPLTLLTDEELEFAIGVLDKLVREKAGLSAEEAYAQLRAADEIPEVMLHEDMMALVRAIKERTGRYAVRQDAGNAGPSG